MKSILIQSMRGSLLGGRRMKAPTITGHRRKVPRHLRAVQSA